MAIGVEIRIQTNYIEMHTSGIIINKRVSELFVRKLNFYCLLQFTRILTFENIMSCSTNLTSRLLYVHILPT